MIGIAAHQRTQAPAVSKLFGVFFQMQHDGGAARGVVQGLDGELAIGLGLPAHTGADRLAGLARQHLNAVCHDEGRIKAHAELADEL